MNTLEKAGQSRSTSAMSGQQTLKQVQMQKPNCNAGEQEILSQYVGWGGLADAFDDRKENWKKEYAQLKELLTLEEYESARGSVLNAHFTSPTVIRAIYNAVENMGVVPRQYSGTCLWNRQFLWTTAREFAAIEALRRGAG